MLQSSRVSLHSTRPSTVMRNVVLDLVAFRHTFLVGGEAYVSLIGYLHIFSPHATTQDSVHSAVDMSISSLAASIIWPAPVSLFLLVLLSCCALYLSLRPPLSGSSQFPPARAQSPCKEVRL